MKRIMEPFARTLRCAARSWPAELGLIGGMYLFGMALTSVLMTTVVDDNSYAPLSLLFAQMGALFALFGVAERFNNGFDLAVKMGETRRGYLWSAFAVTTLEIMAALGIFWLLRLVEKAFQGLVFPGTTLELDPLIWLEDWRLTLGIAVLVIGLAALFGAMLHKYGRKAYWIFWILWMVIFVGGPQVIDAVQEGNNSIVGHIGRFLVGLFGGGFGIEGFCLLLSGGVIGMAVSVLMLRKASVNP